MSKSYNKQFFLRKRRSARRRCYVAVHQPLWRQSGVHLFHFQGIAMSISALTTGTAGLTANQRALDVSANNIANVNTPGFQPQSANFQENSPAGTGVTLSAEGRKLSADDQAGRTENRLAENRPSGVGLASELTDTLVYKSGFNLSANVVKTADQALGSLIDVKS